MLHAKINQANGWVTGIAIIIRNIKLYRNTVIALCTSLVLLACAAEDQAEQYWLITAKPVSIEFVKINLTRDRIAPNTFKVTLADIEVIQGDAPDFKEELTLELYAHDENAIGLYGRIYVVLNTSGESVKAAYWQNVISMACIPSELVDERYGDWYFENKWGSKDKVCRFLRGYQPPQSD